jgi:hypothetical protein
MAGEMASEFGLMSLPDQDQQSAGIWRRSCRKGSLARLGDGRYRLHIAANRAARLWHNLLTC